MAQFILFYVDGPTKRPPELTDEALQRAVGEYVAWGEKLRAAARMLGGARLTNIWTDPGRICSGTGAKFLVTDGPLAETKEVIGGYCVIEATDYAEAARLCTDHPHLTHGRIMIRQLA